MSPEQARGDAVDKRADIWSFGCVVYEMLTGAPVFGGRTTVSDRIAATLEREPDWNALPPHTPVAVRRLLRRCLEKDPARRLHDIADARLELDEVAGGASDAVAVVSSSDRNARRVRWSIAGVSLGTGRGSRGYLCGSYEVSVELQNRKRRRRRSRVSYA